MFKAQSAFTPATCLVASLFMCPIYTVHNCALTQRPFPLTTTESLSTSPPVPSSSALLDMVTIFSSLNDLSCTSMRGCSSGSHIPPQDHIPRGTCGTLLPSPFFDCYISSSAEKQAEKVEDLSLQYSTNPEDRRSGGDQSSASQGSCWSPSYIRRKYPSK